MTHPLSGTLPQPMLQALDPSALDSPVDPTQLAHFVRVVDAWGFTRAAAQLDLTQSTLSRQIGLLEADLGQRLLDRTGRGAVPTDAGLALLRHAKALLELADRARPQTRLMRDPATLLAGLDFSVLEHAGRP